MKTIYLGLVVCLLFGCSSGMKKSDFSTKTVGEEVEVKATHESRRLNSLNFIKQATESEEDPHDHMKVRASSKHFRRMSRESL